MSEEDFNSGLKILDSLISKISNLEGFKPIEKVSFVYYDCKNLKNIETLQNHDRTINILAVSDLDLKEENLVSIEKEKWAKHEEPFYEMTKNGIFIMEDSELGSEESYSILKKLSNYYPMVLIFSNEPLKKKNIEESGFITHKSKDKKISCNINKNIKNFDSFVFQNFDKIKDFIIDISGLKSIRKGKDIFGERKGVLIDLEDESEEEEELKTEEPELEFLKGLPVPTVPKKLNKYNQPTSKQWINEFYEYLKELLNRFFPEKRKNMIPKLLTSDTIKNYWIPSFTHDSANPNRKENYQTVETIGDVSLGFCFISYMTNKIPTANQEDLSNLKQKYMSKPFQAKLGKEMKLTEWMIVCGVPKDRMDFNEDLVEALFGTIERLLFQKCNDLGLGSSVCYNFIKLTFENVNIVLTGDTEKQTSKAGKNIDPGKTFVQQMFQGQAFKQIQLKKFNFRYTNIPKPDSIPDDVWKSLLKDMNKKLEKSGLPPVVTREDAEKRPGIVEDINIRPDGKTKVTIYLMKEYANEARKRGIDIPDERLKLGEDVNGIKKVAENNAYQKAKKFMISKGMTKEWKDQQNKEEKSIDPEKMKLVYEKARKKFKDLTEVYVKRLKPFKGAKDLIPYQIVGMESSGRLVSIFTETVSDQNYEEGIVDDYIEE